MAVTGLNKWNCPACTFNNWPASSKCTLCGSPRPNEMSPLWTPLKRNPPSIYGEPSKTPSPEVNQRRASSDGGSYSKGSKCKTKTKWTCVTCTYSNWANAHQCVMCSTMKTKARTDLLPSSNRPYAIGESILDYASSKGAVGGACLQEERTPQVRPKKDGKNSKDKKWRCQQCTYENYPKSIKCIMCQARRTPSPVREDSTHYPSLPHPLTGNSNKTTPSPPGSPMIPTTPHREDELRERLEALDVGPSSSLKSDTNEVRQIRNRMSSTDWLFLNACLGIANGECAPVKSYLRQVGDRSRQLTKDETMVIGRRHSLNIGSTLVHLAIKFQRSEILGLLLTPASSEARKRLPSETNLDLTASIRNEIGQSLWQRKGEWPVYFFTQLTTFTLPTDIRKFCSSVQRKLLDEIVDRDVEQELSEGSIINWSCEVVGELSSKLYPLWNRTAGDCLLDSVLQATWGVMDREATLRRAMADSLVDGAPRFYQRWKESELRQSMAQGYSLDEEQLKLDWEAVLTLADQTGKSLEQAHIFVLCHLLRRPIIVYGVRVVKNYRGEQLGFANFDGVYLPLLWETSFCWKIPISLAYTRGHFSALIPMGSPQPSGAGVHSNVSHDHHVTYLPLTDSEGQLLQVHFLTEQELGCEERLFNEYCDCHVTRQGLLTAKQEVLSRHQPTVVSQLVDQWLDRFRRLDKRQGAASSCVVYDSDSSS